MPDIDWGTLVQGGSGLIALYLAIQIKGVLANHEARITTLEATNDSPRRRSRSRSTGR